MSDKHTCTDVMLVPAGQARDIYVGVIPGMDIMQLIHCTGRLRAARRATMDSLPTWFTLDYDLSSAQWRKIEDGSYELWMVST